MKVYETPAAAPPAIAEMPATATFPLLDVVAAGRLIPRPSELISIKAAALLHRRRVVG